MTFVWDPVDAVGDVEIAAWIGPSSSVVETQWADNEDRARDFVLVGGLGGAVTPTPL